MADDTSYDQESRRTHHHAVNPPAHAAAHESQPDRGAGILTPHQVGGLLGTGVLQRRGNTPLQTALLLQMQQTHGNQAVQRLVQLQRKANPNSILSNIRTSGAAKGGLKASQNAAEAHEKNVAKYAAILKKVAAKYGFPPALLAAIASRESDGGATLVKAGPLAGTGDGGKGFGLMQVDVQNNPDRSGGPFGEAHINQATGILHNHLVEVSKAHPDWSPAWKLRGAVAAYNVGSSNVRTEAHIDQGTTHNDYSADVWAQARYYADKFPKIFGGSTTLPKTDDGPTTSPTGGVSPTGGATPTGGKAPSRSAPVLKEGDHGAAVKRLQRELNIHGAHPGVHADGKFGHATVVAVENFQRRHHLGVDGIVAAQTWAALNAPVRQPAPDTSPPAGGPAPGADHRTTNERLAKKLLEGGKITFATQHPSGIFDHAMAHDNMVDTEHGKAANRSSYDRDPNQPAAPGGSVPLDTRVLRTMVALQETFTFKVSEIAGAQHSGGSNHYAGRAFDVSVINGQSVTPSMSRALLNRFVAVCQGHNSNEILHPFNRTQDHQDHLHVGWKS